MDNSLWQYHKPFIVEWQPQPEHIDHYGHVNNVAYMAQLEKVAWSHSNYLGLNIDDYKTLDKAMVVQSHNIRYKLPCYLKNTIQCATWIIQCDNKLTLKRKFQYICSQRNKTVFEAETVFVCVTLSSGRPTRMPNTFVEIYGSASLGVSL